MPRAPAPPPASTTGREDGDEKTEEGEATPDGNKRALADILSVRDLAVSFRETPGLEHDEPS